ncbi:uncharacterized protein LOC121420858 [Lytechinus variegatus]|uniref:uncharacterized protein LOC121420858 n=1 Tax=Lytechinus variegatus TaxID=7654 RepID=UPI001BB19794|nr:uncharacterized protein LOC121419489 isoform X2 [Lytechinus variegatus]XP_041471411.1 uncharacterized protein LOC121420858 [Lytechinus variegatus]
MASKLLAVALVVLLVGSVCAFFDLDEDDGGMANGYADDGYSLDEFIDSLQPSLAVKRDTNRAKANRRYFMCPPITGSSQECWCHKKPPQRIFHCFGRSNGK